MTTQERINGIQDLYDALNPILGQHRDQLREDHYYRLTELEAEIALTISYERLTEFVGGAAVIAMMSVPEQAVPRMQLALADENMDAITSNGRTVREVLEEMKRVVA